jgi:hypothetical protein
MMIFAYLIKITLKKFLCIFKVLFGIGFGLVYGFKSAVKDGNDSFLFWERGNGDLTEIGVKIILENQILKMMIFAYL